MGRRGADVSDRILYVPTVSSEHGNRTEMELDLIAESASLRARLAKAARYYEREKPGWCPNDDAHDDAIEAAEQALAAGGEKGGAE
jgi:hypothetical protein